MNRITTLAFAKYFLCFNMIFLLSSCGLFERLHKISDHKKESSSRANKVVEAARDKTGSPYKFGGKTAAGAHHQTSPPKHRSTRPANRPRRRRPGGRHR